MERSIKEQVGAATWESWPVGARMAIADAQATIAALQARVQELEQPVYVCQGCGRLGRDGWLPTSFTSDELRGSVQCPDCGCIDREKNTARELAAICTKAQSELTQRTAELEAAKREVDVWKEKAELRGKEACAQRAELERVSLLSSHNERRFEGVDKKYKELRTLILTLPKVEGEIVYQSGLGWIIRQDSKWEPIPEFGRGLRASLLQHRQGMEG